ncbi:Nn.00g113210.m01.CDS01 [Neocucurbitaria sp. VM-36]
MPSKARLAPKRQPSNLQTLPTELVQKVAANLDDSSLVIFASTSRIMRRRTIYVYGERFFKTIKFCLYPYSLQALTDISYSRFAKHVQNIAFDVEDIGLIDPLHDEDVRQGNRHHGPTAMMPYDHDRLIDLRMRVDSALICQTLSKFPKLKMVLIGGDLTLDGHLIKRSWGAKRHQTFTCPSGHCRTTGGTKEIRHVFQTVGIALENMRPIRTDIKLGVQVGIFEYYYLERVHKAHEVWYSGGAANQRVTDLQLELGHQTKHLHASRIQELLQASGIVSLVVKYVEEDSMDAALTIHLSLLSLRQLQRIVLTCLCAKPSAFVDFFRCHRDRLTHVSLIHCSVVRHRRLDNIFPSPLPPPTSEEMIPDWLLVIKEFQTFSQLKFLELIHLEAERKVDRYEVPRNECLSKDMALDAIWEGKDEINTGLQVLTATYSTIAHPSMANPWNRGPAPPRDYMNMRFANFKASPVYKWTTAEAKALADFRHCHIYCHKSTPGNFKPISKIDDHTQFPVPGFYDESRMPVGHRILPHMLWGKWKTVWVSSAPHTWNWSSENQGSGDGR